MKTYWTFLTLTLTASLALADATFQEKTQIHFGGAVGSVINVFGRKATHEGVVTDVAIYKNRKSSRTGDTGEIVDLDQEKVYHVDYAHKTYKVVTFAELRQQFEDAKKERAESKESQPADKNNAPEYEVEFSVKSTGNKETINGWPTHEEIATAIVHEKGKTLEDAGGFVLTSDMWMGPKLAAKSDQIVFEQKFMKKVYGDSYLADMKQAVATLMANPAFTKAMKTFNEKQKSFEGSAIRSKMTFETVAGKNPPADQQAQPSSAASALGGLLGRMKKHDSNDASAQHSTLFDSNNELLKATNSATAEDVALPAGFSQK